MSEVTKQRLKDWIENLYTFMKEEKSNHETNSIAHSKAADRKAGAIEFVDLLVETYPELVKDDDSPEVH